MTDDNSNLVDIPEDLSSFKDMFLNNKSPESVEVEDTEDDDLATDEGEDASEEEDETQVEEESEEDSDDEGSEDEESDEEPEEPEEPEDKGPKRKPSAQQRINELTRLRHEAERREAAMAERLATIEKQLEAQKPEGSKQPNPLENLPQGAPKPTDKNDDGELKYPLGEFDPNFVYDMTKFTIEAEMKLKEAERVQKEEEAKAAQQRQAIQDNWQQKLDEAEEEIPEIREHIAELADTFRNVEPSYGEYLATVIMTTENGPAIMEYLSQNIGEAQKIVASGPAAATLAIGRLEAKLERLARSDGEEKRNKKISAAAPPPKAQVRGTKGATKVRPDTEDLAAFKRDFGKLL